MLEAEKEGETMEKSARPSSVPPKANGADTKKGAFDQLTWIAQCRLSLDFPTPTSLTVQCPMI